MWWYGGLGSQGPPGATNLPGEGRGEPLIARAPHPRLRRRTAARELRCPRGCGCSPRLLNVVQLSISIWPRHGGCPLGEIDLMPALITHRVGRSDGTYPHRSMPGGFAAHTAIIYHRETLTLAVPHRDCGWGGLGSSRNSSGMQVDARDVLVGS